jgi:hypothetical protein
MKQTEAKLSTYKDLRAFDRDNFVQAYNRKNIKARRFPGLACFPCGSTALALCSQA